MLPPFVPPAARAATESLPLITEFVIGRAEPGSAGAPEPDFLLPDHEAAPSSAALAAGPSSAAAESPSLPAAAEQYEPRDAGAPGEGGPTGDAEIAPHEDGHSVVATAIAAAAITAAAIAAIPGRRDDGRDAGGGAGEESQPRTETLPSIEEFVLRVSREPSPLADEAAAAAPVGPAASPAAVGTPPDAGASAGQPPRAAERAAPAGATLMAQPDATQPPRVDELQSPIRPEAVDDVVRAAPEPAGAVAPGEYAPAAPAVAPADVPPHATADAPAHPTVDAPAAGWVSEERDAFDWGAVAQLAASPDEVRRASDEWSQTEWERPAAGGPGSEQIALMLVQLARRVRSGELQVPGYRAMRPEAALAAVLSALLSGESQERGS